MPITSRRLFSKDQTGREMNRLISLYSGDLRNIKVWHGGKLLPFPRLPLDRAFDFVRRIPYRQDTKPVEVVARPRTIFKDRFLGMDCKKKAIFLGSYLKERNLPFRLVASSRLRNGRIHHVFPQVFLGQWLNFDATYSHYQPFEPKELTRMEVLQ